MRGRERSAMVGFKRVDTCLFSYVGFCPTQRWKPRRARAASSTADTLRCDAAHANFRHQPMAARQNPPSPYLFSAVPAEPQTPRVVLLLGGNPNVFSQF